MSTLAVIDALAASRPTSDTPVAGVAAWYERKAVVLRLIADTSGSRTERDTYRSFADQAHQHAARLLAPGEDMR